MGLEPAAFDYRFQLLSELAPKRQRLDLGERDMAARLEELLGGELVGLIKSRTTRPAKGAGGRRSRETQALDLFGWCAFVLDQRSHQIEQAISLVRCLLPEVAGLTRIVDAVEEKVLISSRIDRDRRFPKGHRHGWIEVALIDRRIGEASDAAINGVVDDQRSG